MIHVVYCSLAVHFYLNLRYILDVYFNSSPNPIFVENYIALAELGENPHPEVEKGVYNNTEPLKP